MSNRRQLVDYVYEILPYPLYVDSKYILCMSHVCISYLYPIYILHIVLYIVYIYIAYSYTSQPDHSLLSFHSFQSSPAISPSSKTSLLPQIHFSCVFPSAGLLGISTEHDTTN